jgi:hypothetical protein
MDIYLPADFHTIRAAEKAYSGAHHDTLTGFPRWFGAEAMVTHALYALTRFRKRRATVTQPDPTWQVL